MNIIKNIYLVSAISTLLIGCSTTNYPELPSVLDLPQPAERPRLAELPQLPGVPQGNAVPQAASLPQFSELPQTTELPQLPQSTEFPQATEQAQAPESSQVEALAEVTEQTEALFTEIPLATELAQDSAAAPTPSANDTQINIEFIYKEPVVESSSNIPFENIADDLVSVLAYIPAIQPARTSIRVSTPGSEFDSLVKSSMQKLGYDFNTRSSHSRRQHLTTSFLETKKEPDLSELTAIMAIDGTLIKRTYLMRNNAIEPVSYYTIHGIDAQQVLPNDQISVL